MPLYPKKEMKHHSSRQPFFACKGQFVGINAAQQEFNLARKSIHKIQYKGKSWNWNWDNQCTKFHQQIQVNDAWVAAGLATRMSKEDKISSFLKTISMNCKNSELGIAWGIIKGNMSRFPTLIGTVIPHLSLCIELQEQGAPNAKHTIANTC